MRITLKIIKFKIILNYKNPHKIGKKFNNKLNNIHPMTHRSLYFLITLIVIIILIFAYYNPYNNLVDDKNDKEKKDQEVKNSKPIIINIPKNIWPQYRMITTHDGRAHPNSSLKGRISEIWVTRDLNQEYYGASKSSPAVDKNLVFIGADTGNLHAFNRTTGKEVWKFKTRESVNGIHGSPGFDEEKVYIGAYDGWLYAIFKNNGSLAWETKIGDYIGSSPCLYDGVVYIGVEMAKPAGYLVGCDIFSGEEVFRSKEFGSHPHSSPSIDPLRGYIFIGANDKRVYCYNITTKSEVWNYKTGGEIKSTPCIAGEALYITSWDNKLYCLNLSTGARFFSFKTKSKTMSSPAVDSNGKHIYFGSHDEYIYCLSAKNGTQIWKKKTGAIIISSPTVVEKDGYIICGSNDKNVYILDLGSGKIIKKLELESSVTSVPVIVQNQLYVFDNEGRLHRFDAK